MNLETKITIYKFTPQVFTLTHILSQNAQGKYTFSLFFFLRCTLYYVIMALDKFRFAAANHTVSICGLYGPQLATVEPAIAKRGFC
jgi:hypothetical protein